VTGTSTDVACLGNGSAFFGRGVAFDGGAAFKGEGAESAFFSTTVFDEKGRGFFCSAAEAAKDADTMHKQTLSEAMRFMETLLLKKGKL